MGQMADYKELFERAAARYEPFGLTTESLLFRRDRRRRNQRITAGVRMYPWLPGLNVLLAADVGVGGTTNFVQELAPTTPYRVIMAAARVVLEPVFEADFLPSSFGFHRASSSSGAVTTRRSR